MIGEARPGSQFRSHSRGVVPGFFLVALMVSGCDPACGQLDATLATLELGTGAEDYEAISEGQALEPVFGLQGGYHIWGAVQVRGIQRGPVPGPTVISPVGGVLGPATVSGHPEVEFEIGDADGQIGFSSRTQRPLERPDGDTGETAGVTIFLLVNPWDTPWFWPEGHDPDEAMELEEQELANGLAKSNFEARSFTMQGLLVDACGTEVRDSRSIRISTAEALDLF